MPKKYNSHLIQGIHQVEIDLLADDWIVFIRRMRPDEISDVCGASDKSSCHTRKGITTLVECTKKLGVRMQEVALTIRSPFHEIQIRPHPSFLGYVHIERIDICINNAEQAWETFSL